jgi:glycyl-tRNA synthetase beta chain
MLQPLLIEIGVEELPAAGFLKELPNIQSKWLSILQDNALGADFDFFYTPRRLVLWHREFKTKQDDTTIEQFGAPVSIAFKDSQPTPAALGFAKKCGVDVAQLQRANKGGKEVLYFESKQEGLASKSVIPKMVQEFIASLNFGKTMRWGDNPNSFIRPIRWVCATLGDEAIDFDLFGVCSTQKVTYAHRMAKESKISYEHIGDYFCKLDKNGVILYQNERHKKIIDDFSLLEKSQKFVIGKDDDLLEEVIAITEYPTAVVGSFDEEFLRLPTEVIVTSMKEHQRYFPVYVDGKLINKFVVISNAHTDDFANIIKGNEKVLRARLSDALFFFENDIRNGFDVEGLKNIRYLEGLGSVYEKVQREKKIALMLYKHYKDLLKSHENEKLIERTAKLSKADLLSEMVYEFTELQGVMGSYYAEIFKEDASLALAIKEQYLPQGEDDALPSSTYGALFALSLRLEALFGLFSIGKIPTGTKDPFALRRAVNGIIKIVIDKKLPFDISEMFAQIKTEYQPFDIALLEEFFVERIYKNFDANPSIITSVLASGERDICQIQRKIEAVNAIVSTNSFKEIFSTFKRVANITKDVDLGSIGSVDVSLFESEYEHTLLRAFDKADALEAVNYEQKLDNLFSIKKELDQFFDNVMVNSEDEAIKNNRKTLIATIYKAFKNIADIKEITI